MRYWDCIHKDKVAWSSFCPMNGYIVGVYNYALCRAGVWSNPENDSMLPKTFANYLLSKCIWSRGFVLS